MKNLLICFSAGCLGALANSLVVWQFGEQGIARLLGVSIAPTLTSSWLYPRIVWGGIWGLLFILPFLKSRFLLKGSLLSLFPTAVQLFYIFPHVAGKGLAGTDLGTWTPLMVLIYNWVWGIVTCLTIRFSR
ncbi:MAG: hypothetical protein V2J08_03210 [Desulfotignum sp.]|jgi:hypothetical protein|nr:hypothetical protein [Desulfotignum sp.]